LKSPHPTVHGHFGVVFINGAEKGKAQEMIPMAMSEEEMHVHRLALPFQVHPQEAHAGAAVDDYPVSRIQGDFHTGGVTPEL
jgi:hypothetical protein